MTVVQRFRVRVDARDHEVEVDARGRVRVDGVAFDVVHGASGRIAVRAADGTQRLVTVAPGSDPRDAAEGGIAHAIQVMTAQQAALADLGGARNGTAAGRTIASPMPGRIVRVLVAEGDVVQADTPAVIVEAMKMENEVRTTHACRVARVLVEAGATVDAGQVLLELEPHVPTSESAPDIVTSASSR